MVERNGTMWLHIASLNTVFNLDYVARLYVEETGAGAAMKADINGKVMMVHYFESKAEAQAALADILNKQEAGVRVIRL